MKSFCLQWIAFRFIFLTIFHSSDESSVKVEGCVGSVLNLECDRLRVVKIIEVLLGDSWCSGSSCCPKDDSCTRPPNSDHIRHVERECNFKQRCQIKVFTEEIQCGFKIIGGWSKNDFEHIRYECRNTQESSTSTHLHLFTTTSDRMNHETQSTESSQNVRLTTKDISSSTTEEIEDGHHVTDAMDMDESMMDENRADEAKHKNSQTTLTIVLVVILSLIFILIIAIIIMFVKRKKNRKSEPLHETELTFLNSADGGVSFASNHANQSCHDNGSSPLYSNDVQRPSNQSKATYSDTRTGATAELSNEQDDHIYCDVDRRDTERNPKTNVYSLAGKTGSMVNDDSGIYSDVESGRAAAAAGVYQTPTPRNNVYSIAGNVAESTSDEDGNIYCDVECREPADTIHQTPKPKMAHRNHSPDAITTNDNDTAIYSNVISKEPVAETGGVACAGVKVDEKKDGGTQKNTNVRPPNDDYEVPNAVNYYPKTSKDPKNTPIKNKEQAGIGVYEEAFKWKDSTAEIKSSKDAKMSAIKNEEQEVPGSPHYELMSRENVYANDAMDLSKSLRKTRLKSEPESPYCEMKSPNPSDTGGREELIVVDNELYST